MEEMSTYLDAVCKGELPINHQIIYNLQDMFNLSPDLKVEELVKAFAVKTNDNMLAIYVSSLIRSIIALHNLINNKLANRQLEQEKKTKEVEDALKAEKDKMEKEKADKEKADKDKAEKDKEKDKPASNKDKDAGGKDAASPGPGAGADKSPDAAAKK